MKRFLKRTLVFTIIAVIIYSILIILMGLFLSPKFGVRYVKGLYGFTYSRLEEVKTIRNVNILFLGSSHTYRGFDPRIFKKEGISCFNMGSSNQTHIQTEILLKRYLDIINPEMIIYEVDPSIFSTEGVESALDLISNDKNDLESVKLALKLNSLMVYNTLAYSFLNDLFTGKIHFVEDSIKGDDTYVKNGYVEKKLKYFKKTNFTKSEIKLNQEQVHAFENCISIIKKKNIKLVFIFAPVSNSLYSSYSNVLIFNGMMNNYGKYYDFNRIIQLDDSLCFYDPEHLNQMGVALFNTKLISVFYADSLFNSFNAN